MENTMFRDPVDAMGFGWFIDSLTGDVKEPVSLKWSRLGVFTKIYKRLGILREVMLEKDLSKKETMYAFEEVRIDGFVRLNPVCAKTRLGYYFGLGFQQRRTNGGKIIWSPLLITPHALERLNQRGGNQRVTPQGLWNETDQKWMNHLCQYVLRYRQDEPSSKLWLVPLSKGAFVIKPEKITDGVAGSVMKLRPSLRRKNQQMRWDTPYSHALTAVTYISNWDMYPEQEKIVKLIRDGQYDDAYDLIFA